MVPINVEDVKWGVAAAQRLYSIGFKKINSAGQKYRDFGENIRVLAINLDLISSILQQALSQATTFSVVRRPVPAAHQVLGNFTETLIDCERLLDDQRYFTKHDGFVSNVSLYYQTDPEAQKLKDRIALHNIKLSISLKILDSQILGERFIQIWDPTNAILNAFEQLGRQIRGEEERFDLANRPLGPVAIPQELEDGFSVFAQSLFPNLSAIPIERGIDIAVFHFNRVTETPDQPVHSEIKYLITIINITMAVWLIRTVKAGQDYQNAVQYWPPNTVERLMNQWGMTIERFFNQLEENLHEAFRCLLGPHQLLPPTPDLLEIFEKERLIWQRGSIKMPEQEKWAIEHGTEITPVKFCTEKMPAELGTEIMPTELGTEIMMAFLRSPDPSYTQTLGLYCLKEKCFNLLLVKTATSEGRDKETTDSYDLEHVQIIPTYAMQTWKSPPLDPLTIRFRANSNSPIYRNLAFHQSKDMFQFQQAITKFKVVYDKARVLVTSQESKFLGGTKRQDLCRLQIWTASPSRDETLVAAQIPTPLSISTASIASPRTSFASITPLQPMRKPSAFTFSSVSSRRNESTYSISSTSSDPRAPPNSAVPRGGGAIFAPPVTPRVVLFAHKVSEGGMAEEISRSLVIIDVNPDVVSEEQSIESDDAHAPSYRCILERKGSYLPARRSPETSDPDRWDLAVAGLHKIQAGTEVVKKLKYVIIQFDTQNNLSQFVAKFKQVKDLAKLRLAQFLQATGQG